MLPPPPRSTLFPYTTLFRSLPFAQVGVEDRRDHHAIAAPRAVPLILPRDCRRIGHVLLDALALRRVVEPRDQDRKSTRLNSSHVSISYAVFCLKKKTTLSSS